MDTQSEVDEDQIADEYDELSEINSELPSPNDNMQEFVETDNSANKMPASRTTGKFGTQKFMSGDQREAPSFPIVTRVERLKATTKEKRLRTQQLKDLKSRMKREKDLGGQNGLTYSKEVWEHDDPKSLERKKTPVPNIPVNLV